MLFGLLNVALQAGLDAAIDAANVTGTGAMAAKLAGQAAIYGLAGAAGPIGWAYAGVRLAYKAAKYLSDSDTNTEKKP
jgi:uncharacterized protein YaaW (UPF0174 family)